MASNRGVAYVGPGKVEVQSIDYPKLVGPGGRKCDHGVILKLVSTNICGSDQHTTGSRGDRRLDRQPAESIWTSSITVFESRLGLELLPKGRRRQRLEASFDRLLEEDLENRVLAFDTVAAVEAAHLAAQRQRAGRPVDMRDTQIAGIALARRAAIATRNHRHFDGLAVPVVNPWAQAP